MRISILTLQNTQIVNFVESAVSIGGVAASAVSIGGVAASIAYNAIKNHFTFAETSHFAKHLVSATPVGKTLVAVFAISILLYITATVISQCKTELQGYSRVNLQEDDSSLDKKNSWTYTPLGKNKL